MANATVPRIAGDDYQARFFWFQVCRMFQPHTNVAGVSYEWDEVKVFDDVVVVYDPPVANNRGGSAHVDYFQVKYHVSQEGFIGWQDLMDPHFIGATAYSFLQRLRDGYAKTVGNGRGARFFLVTPWGLNQADPLARLVSNNAHELHLDRLYDGGGPKSAMGGIRAAWAAHLNVSETELRDVLASLRVSFGWGSLSELNDRLNEKLAVAGFRPVSDGHSANPYDDLIRKLVRAGRTTFTVDDIREICGQEGLWVGAAHAQNGATDIGIRSFMRRTEYMEDETEHMLDLVPYFADRHIRAPNLWLEGVLRDLAGFLKRAIGPGGEYRLHLDAHTAIAFAAGYHLDTKAGARVRVVQKTLHGRDVWTPEPMQGVQAGDLWSYEVTHLEPSAQDIALGVSVTHDVGEDVRAYLSKSGTRVRALVNLRIRPVPNNSAVRGGAHALALVQQLVAQVRDRRAEGKPGETIHLFIAAPNGFSFFLGQQGRALGRTAVYEYDFDAGALGAYELALRFPEDVTAN